MGCNWIDGDDYLERLHRGEEIYCGAPTLRAGKSYCAVHRARAYLSTAASDFMEQRIEPPELTPGQCHRFIALRRAGLSFARAVDLALRPPANLLIARRATPPATPPRELAA